MTKMVLRQLYCLLGGVLQGFIIFKEILVKRKGL